MSKKLVIVESPSKSKTIEQYLGSEYQVLSSKGHVRDLSISGPGGLGLDIENNFKPKYSTIKEKASVIKELKKAVKKAEEIFLATDPDREGEAISWHLREILDIDSKPTKRVIFNEITKDAIIRAFQNTRDIDENLVSSQETRRILDRIIGFKLSKLLQNKIKSKSAGRVQSVALKLIVEKEKEIKSFVKEEYWTVEAIFDNFKAELTKINNKKVELPNEEKTLDLVNSLSDDFLVDKVETLSRKRESKLPFITSTLQQEASTKLNFSARKTMLIAQKLYEGIDFKDEKVGLITYMRTDSARLADSFTKDAFTYIKNQFGEEYVGSIKKAKKKKNVQDAHEGIRHTDMYKTPSEVKKYLSKDELSLYTLIYSRTLASLMKPALFNVVNLHLVNNNCLFKTSSSKLVFDGYLKVYSKYEKVSNTELPPLEENKTIKSNDILKQQHFTQPPSRYTEAKLIKDMEELGIGRPSTYSLTITTLKNRKYVSQSEKKFIPTEQGELTNEKLGSFFEEIINVDYTAKMESILDEIAQGEENQSEVISSFYNSFIPLVEIAKKEMEKLPPKFTGEDCPECGSPMVFRASRYGAFEACSGYPGCKYIKQNGDKETKPLVSTGIKCPKCNEGEIVERTAKKGRNAGKKFFACNNFPKCRNMLTGKPTGELCPDCGNLLITDKNENTVCQDTKNCGYKK